MNEPADTGASAAPGADGLYAVLLHGGLSHATCMSYDEALHEARQWQRSGHAEARVVLLTPA